MNVRAATQLQLYLDRQLMWRKKELTSLKFCVSKALMADRPVLLRAALGLLYAHWEGFIKDGTAAYVEHAAAQGLTITQFRPHFRAIALRSKLEECANSKDLAIRRAFFEFLHSGLDTRARFAGRSLIRTRSNLKAAVLKEIVVALGLDFSPFSLKSKTIIDRLAKMRNQVMHGRGAPVEAADYIQLHEEIVLLIDEFKTQIEIAAANKGYAA